MQAERHRETLFEAREAKRAPGGVHNNESLLFDLVEFAFEFLRVVFDECLFESHASIESSNVRSCLPFIIRTLSRSLPNQRHCWKRPSIRVLKTQRAQINTFSRIGRAHPKVSPKGGHHHSLTHSLEKSPLAQARARRAAGRRRRETTTARAARNRRDGESVSQLPNGSRAELLSKIVPFRRQRSLVKDQLSLNSIREFPQIDNTLSFEKPRSAEKAL